VLMFPDRTRIELGSQAVLATIEEGDAGKRLVLDKGSLKARVSKQLAGRPLVFSTPHGEATVVGTILRLVVDKGTRLDVDEGKVRLKNKAGKSVEVVEGR